MTPIGIDLDQYKTQAKDLLKSAKASDTHAIARFRDSHPEHDLPISSGRITLSDAQLVIARENDQPSWTKFKENLLFTTAVNAIEAGDTARLKELIGKYPPLVKYRGSNRDFAYFKHATLLHYVAGNPKLFQLPGNIVEIAEILLAHGADPNSRCGVPGNESSTIGLILTSKQASESGTAMALIDLLGASGAQDAVRTEDPKLLDYPIWNGGIETAKALVRRGVRMDLPQAAALGRLDVVERIMKEEEVSADLLETALAFACVQNQLAAVRYLTAIGAKGDVIPSPKSRGGGQATALHDAAVRGLTEIVTILLDHGASASVRDNQYNGTPAGWAQHGGHTELAAVLRQRESAHV